MSRSAAGESRAAWPWLKLVLLVLAGLLLLLGTFLAGVRMGGALAVRGTLPAGELQAGRSVVEAARSEPSGSEHGVFGTVVAIEGREIVLARRRDGQVRIQAGEGTKVKRGRQRVDFQEIRVGSQLGVLGRPRPGGEIEARVIWILDDPEGDR